MSDGLRILLSTFALLLVAELGDKTQLAVINMTAKYRAPVWVFAGAALALVSVTLLGVICGEVLTRFIPEMILRKAAAVLFVVMGVLMWFEVL
jgi:putative Ca2+/H+ antiporter (TMEM165/GDT1 family)